MQPQAQVRAPAVALRPTVRVLVVEDDPLFRRFVMAALGEARRLAVEAEGASSLAEALQAVDVLRFDCILLDLGVADCGGAAGVRRVLSAAPKVPLVVLAGADDAAVGDDVLREGAQEFIEKSQVEPSTLERSIRHAVDRGRWSAELAATNEELERRNRDLDDFAHAVTHDLKAPLRAVYHLLQEAEEAMAESDTTAARQALTGAKPRIARLFTMIDGVLRLTQAGRGRREAAQIDAGALVREVVGSLAVPRGFQVLVRDPMPSLVGDRAEMGQVFQNLVDNALKHHDGKQGTVEVAGRDLGAWVEFTVSDDGPGIPEALRERAFQIFQTLGGVRSDNSGVGLALVRKVVEANGGTIRIEEAPRRGACFRFTWPKSPPS